MTLAGFPTAMAFSGILLTTTLPAPITELSSIVTPGRMVQFAPIPTFLPIITGLGVALSLVFGLIS